jgi:hypothetical protein
MKRHDKVCDLCSKQVGYEAPKDGQFILSWNNGNSIVNVDLCSPECFMKYYNNLCQLPWVGWTRYKKLLPIPLDNPTM